MKKSLDIVIVHVFALLHAVVALACRYFGLLDDLLLTLLSMLMVAMISFKRQRGVVFMIASIVGANVLGYLFGTGISSLFSRLFSSPLFIYPVSTFVSTELIGWGVYAAASWITRGKNEGKDRAVNVRWMLLAFMSIVIVRLVLVVSGVDAADSHAMMVNMLVDYAFSCLAFILVAEYALRARTQAKEEKERANLAQYRYMKLKEQVNPHFLFNSLNILDCMIQEQSPEEASRYTHKLAEIYRYLLHSEEREKVSLREELEFVSQYTDLLLVRFPEGFEVNVDVPESLLNKNVIPCSLQLLIENATKHNAVMPQKPLRVTIVASGDIICVTNTVQPRMGQGSESTGLGLKYIRRQYEDIGGKEISIESSDSLFKVILPLL